MLFMDFVLSPISIFEGILSNVFFLVHQDIGQEKPKYGARDERVSTLRRRAAAPLRRYSD